jgi:hypothetical protein
MKKLLLITMIFWSFGSQSQTSSISTVDQLKKFKSKGELAKLSDDKKAALFKTFFEEQVKKASSLESEVKNLNKSLSAFDLTLKSANESWNKLYTETKWANAIGRGDLETLSQAIELLNKKDNDIELLLEKFEERREKLDPTTITEETEEYFGVLFDAKIPVSVSLKVDDKLRGIDRIIESDLAESKEVYFSIQSILMELDENRFKTQMSFEQVMENNKRMGINKVSNSSTSFLNLVKTVKSLGMYSFTPKISAQ